MSQLAMRLPRGVTTGGVSASDVRRAREDEADRLASLLSAAFPTEAWDAARVGRELLDASDVEATYVIERNQELVATASARTGSGRFAGTGYLHWVAVSPAQQGMGLGRRIVTAVTDHFADQPVCLETDDERLPALRSYLGLGFVPLYVDDDHEARWSKIFVALNAQAHPVRRGAENAE